MRRSAAAVGGALLVAAALSACTAARNTLGTTSSPCFRALALAQDAVHDHGTFVGVKLVSASQMAKLDHLRKVISDRSRTPVRAVCVVGYRGDYRRDQVERPAGPVPSSGVGHFAVVVVSSPQNVLLATIVLEREPLRFRHLALGAVPGAAHPPGRPATTAWAARS